MTRGPLLALALLTACAGDDTDGDDTDVGDTETDSDVPPARLVVFDSFETPVLMSGGGYATGLDAPWRTVASLPLPSTLGGVGTLRPGPSSLDDVEPLAAPGDGAQVAWLAAAGDGFDETDVHLLRRVVDAGEAGVTYTARFALGARADLPTPQYLWVALGETKDDLPWLVEDRGAQLSLDPGTLPVGALAPFELTWRPTEATAGHPVDLHVYVGAMSSFQGDRQILMDDVRVWIGVPD